MLYNEDTLAQQTIADYLRDELGWESVYAYNSETSGSDGTLGRKDDTEVVLTRYLREALMQFNPDLPKQAYQEAVRQISAYYKDTIPHLFYYNAVIVLANGVDAKIGSLSSKFEHFHEWKRLQEDGLGVVDMETLLKGICTKKHFLDLFENFIVFDDSSGKPVKIVARNHQFLGVNLAVQAVRTQYAKVPGTSEVPGTLEVIDEQTEIYRCRQIAWMKETRMAIVVSEEQGEVDKFRQWGVDIVPHRELMKNGFETGDGKRLDVDNWREKEATRDAVKVNIKDFLYSEKTGLPLSYTEEEIDRKADIVYAHIFESYRGPQSSVYDEDVA